jgi:hypothetical protein
MATFPFRSVARVALPAAVLLAAAVSPVLSSGASAAPEVARFQLTANPKFVNCLAQFPGDDKRPPKAEVRVERGNLNDTLRLELHNIKPHLAFDLFTVQRSNLTASGTPDPSFKNFGLAWYQSDVEANADGEAEVAIRTVLLDQIFGFDPDVSLAPTNTFHVGFWFNKLDDALPCDPNTKATPFNGEHHAGPLAMISLPDAATGLGPLCLKPDTSVSPARCDP